MTAIDLIAPPVPLPKPRSPVLRRELVAAALWEVVCATSAWTRWSRPGCFELRQTLRKPCLSGTLRGVGEVRMAHDSHRRIGRGLASVVAEGG